MTVEVARAYHHRVGIDAFGEAAAEAGVNTDVHEHPAGAQYPGHLSQYDGVIGHVGVDHHGDDGRHGAVLNRQPLGIGQSDG